MKNVFNLARVRLGVIGLAAGLACSEEDKATTEERTQSISSEDEAGDGVFLVEGTHYHVSGTSYCRIQDVSELSRFDGRSQQAPPNRLHGLTYRGVCACGATTSFATCASTEDTDCWRADFSGTIVQTVDTSHCGFANTPQYFTSIGGISGHEELVSTWSLLEASATQFKLIARPLDPTTPGAATSGKWQVNWQAIPGKPKEKQLCADSTSPSDWVVDPSDPSGHTLLVNVDTSACDFDGTPAYAISLEGSAGLAWGAGLGTVHNASASGFQVKANRFNLTWNQAQAWEWRINWVGRRQVVPAGQLGTAASCVGAGSGVWEQIDSKRISTFVDTSSCGLAGVPLYFPSLTGVASGYNGQLRGVGAVHNPSSNGFLTIIQDSEGAGNISASDANSQGWSVSWSTLNGLESSDPRFNAPIKPVVSLPAKHIWKQTSGVGDQWRIDSEGAAFAEGSAQGSTAPTAFYRIDSAGYYAPWFHRNATYSAEVAEARLFQGTGPSVEFEVGETWTNSDSIGQPIGVHLTEALEVSAGQSPFLFDHIILAPLSVDNESDGILIEAEDWNRRQLSGTPSQMGFALATQVGESVSEAVGDAIVSTPIEQSGGNASMGRTIEIGSPGEYDVWIRARRAEATTSTPVVRIRMLGSIYDLDGPLTLDYRWHKASEIQVPSAGLQTVVLDVLGGGAVVDQIYVLASQHPASAQLAAQARSGPALVERVEVSELPENEPGVAPIVHQPGFEKEREAQEYNPHFVPLPVSIDPLGVAYIRRTHPNNQGDQRRNNQWNSYVGTSTAQASQLKLQVLSGSTWSESNDGIRRSLESALPNVLAGSYSIRSGQSRDEKIVFDDQGDAYTLVHVSNGSVYPPFLLHHREGDLCAADDLDCFDSSGSASDDWAWEVCKVNINAYEGAHLEARDGHNDRSEPPVLVLTDSALQKEQELAIVAPKKNAQGYICQNGAVALNPVRSGITTAYVNSAHSGGGKTSVTLRDPQTEQLLTFVSFAKTFGAACSRDEDCSGEIEMPDCRVPPMISENGARCGRVDEGVAQMLAVYEHGTGQWRQSAGQTWTHQIALGHDAGSWTGCSTPRNTVQDPTHLVPSLTVDSSGFLTYVIPAHHRELRYTTSTIPYRGDAWGPVSEVDSHWTYTCDQGGYTYVALLTDQTDTMHLVSRFAGTILGRSNYGMQLTYLRKPAEAPLWDKAKFLVDPNRSRYHVWYHKMSLDDVGNLYLSYMSYTNEFDTVPLPGEASNEYDAYMSRWPFDGDGNLGCTLAGSTWRGCSAVQAHDMSMLLSNDGGESWRLATTPDFQGAVPGTQLVYSLGQVRAWIRGDDSSATVKSEHYYSIPNRGSISGKVAGIPGNEPDVEPLGTAAAPHFSGTNRMVFSWPPQDWSVLHDGTSAATMAMRFLLDNVVHGAILWITFDGGAAHVGLNAFVYNGKIQLRLGNGSGSFGAILTSNVTLAPGWHTLVLTKSGTELAVSVDDEPDVLGTISNPNSAAPSFQPYLGNSYSGGAPLNGSIAEFVVFDDALDVGEKSALVSYLETRWN